MLFGVTTAALPGWYAAPARPGAKDTVPRDGRLDVPYEGGSGAR